MSKLSDVVLHAEPRETRGKEKAKKLRQNGQIPAIIYGGKGKVEQAVTLDGQEMLIAGQHAHGELRVFNLQMSGESHRVLFKEIQRDPVTTRILHADMIVVQDDTVVTMSVPVISTGDIPAGVKAGGQLERVSFRINVRGKVSDLPGRVEADLSTLEAGKAFAVRHLPALEGVEYVDGPARVLFKISSKRGGAKAGAAGDAAAAAPAAPAAKAAPAKAAPAKGK
jgi:large subunit ribosomal protein L25